MQIFRDVKAVFALHNSLGSNFCIANIPCAGRIAGIIARTVHTREPELDYNRVTGNSRNRRLADTLNRNRAAHSGATATADNRHLRLRRTVLHKGQLTVLVGNVILMPGILADVIQLSLNLTNSSVQAVHRALHVSYIIFRLRNIIANTVNNRGIRLFRQQRVSRFLVIIGSFQRLRQIANAVLQVLYRSIIAFLVGSEVVTHRLHCSLNLGVNRFAIGSRPLRSRRGIQRNLFDLGLAVLKGHILGVSIVGDIKIRQTVQTIDLIRQRIYLGLLGIVGIKVTLDLRLDALRCIGDLVIHIRNGLLSLLGALLRRFSSRLRL